VDRRSKGTVSFAAVDGEQQAFKGGTSLTIEPKAIAAADWPAVGTKRVRQALLDAGLFEVEADSLLKIWHKRLLEAEGITVFLFCHRMNTTACCRSPSFPGAPPSGFGSASLCTLMWKSSRS
jgi:hypothetical protein